METSSSSASRVLRTAARCRTEPAAGAPSPSTDAGAARGHAPDPRGPVTSSSPVPVVAPGLRPRRSPPAFADEVTTWVDGAPRRRSDPTTLRTWGTGSPLEALLAVADDVRPERVGQTVAVRIGGDGPVPPECDRRRTVRRPSARLRRDPSRPQAWFAYERDGETARACSSTSSATTSGVDRPAPCAPRTLTDCARPRRRAGEHGGQRPRLVLVAFARASERADGSRRRGPPLRRRRLRPHGVRRRRLGPATAWLVCDPASATPASGRPSKRWGTPSARCPSAHGAGPAEAPPGTARW